MEGPRSGFTIKRERNLNTMISRHHDLLQVHILSILAINYFVLFIKFENSRF